MKLGRMYELTVANGMAKDPRGKERVAEELERTKEDYEKLDKTQREEFDQERLTNPYSDTRILHGDPEIEVKGILVGIDIGVPEILVADRLREKGKNIDLILSHHPAGRAYASYYEVMSMQSEILSLYGIPINVAEGIMEDRIKEVERKVLPVNHMRAVDVAKIFDIPFMCIHTPADNMVATYLQRIMDGEGLQRVSDIIERLKEVLEYREAARNNAGPKVIVGSPHRHAGKVFVDMTGGTEGSLKAFEKLSQAGVGTIVGMHISEKHYEEAEKHHINVIVAGHIPSDTLGLNLMLDELEKEDKPARHQPEQKTMADGFEIIGCSGFRRFKHAQKD